MSFGARQAMADKIFINYRREDSIGTAGRLRDRLAEAFGEENLFMDVDNIPAGVDFVADLNNQVTACRVFLAVIGPNWLDAKDESGVRRLDNPDDFVTIEIAAALARDIRVIPVLVDNARMPKADKLPEHIRPLVRRNAVEVRNTQFRRDAETLVARMREALGQKAGGQGRWRVRAAAGAAAVAVAVVVVVGWFAWISPPQPRDIGDTPPPVSVYSALIPTLRLLLMENK
jgi:TIR domain